MVVYKIYPEENVDLDKLAAEIGKIEHVRGVQREPVAFGLEVLKVGATMDDKKDNPEELEKKIREVSGVREVETADVGLI